MRKNTEHTLDDLYFETIGQNKIKIEYVTQKAIQNLFLNTKIKPY